MQQSPSGPPLLELVLLDVLLELVLVLLDVLLELVLVLELTPWLPVELVVPGDPPPVPSPFVEEHPITAASSRQGSRWQMRMMGAG